MHFGVHFKLKNSMLKFFPMHFSTKNLKKM